jgi:hypothetical protein
VGDRLARYFVSTAGAASAEFVRPAYLAEWDPVTGANRVLFSGTQEFVNLAYLGPAANLSVGRVLLLLTPGAPVILGRLTKPNPGGA